MLLFVLAALAAPLQVVSVMADGNAALEVQYALTAESWYPIQQGLAEPTLVYTLDGRVVAQERIRGQVGKHVLTREKAYNDSQLTVEVRDAKGVFDSLQVGGWSGGAYGVRILGPTRPVAPAPARTTTTTTTTTTTSTSSTSTSGSSRTSTSGAPVPSNTRTTTTTSANVDIDVQPEDVVAIATDTIALIQQQQQRQQQKAASASVGNGNPDAPVQVSGPAPLDPNDPTVKACAAVDRNRVTQCVATYGPRPQGAAELEACGRFTVPGLQRECREHVEKSALPLLDLIEACQEGFGTETPGVRCMNVAADAATPPAQDVRACTEHLEVESDRLGCIARFSEVEWSPAGVLPVCKAAYPDDVLGCLAHIAGPFPEKPGLAQACVDGMEGELGLDCMAMMRRREGDPAALVQACTAGFETGKERFKCVEVARSPKVDAARITACAADDRPLKCLER